jgi:hypothetical protein
MEELRYYSNELARFLTPDWAAKATALDALTGSDNCLKKRLFRGKP